MEWSPVPLDSSPRDPSKKMILLQERSNLPSRLHRRMRRWENAYLWIGRNRCTGSSPCQRTLGTMIEGHLHESADTTLLSRITEPMAKKLNCSPTMWFREGRSVESRLDWFYHFSLLAYSWSCRAPHQSSFDHHAYHQPERPNIDEWTRGWASLIRQFNDCLTLKHSRMNLTERVLTKMDGLQLGEICGMEMSQSFVPVNEKEEAW